MQSRLMIHEAKKFLASETAGEPPDRLKGPITDREEREERGEREREERERDSTGTTEIG